MTVFSIFRGGAPGLKERGLPLATYHLNNLEEIAGEQSVYLPPA